MRKVVFIYLSILCLSVSSVLGGNLFVRDVDAIPNSNVPAPDGHPHTCGEARFPGKLINGTVKWTIAQADPYDASGILQNPDNVCHQHRESRNFNGYEDLSQPFSAFAVWDDESWKPSEAAVFDRGHGFINEWTEAGGGDQTVAEPAGQSDSIPDYFFKGPWDPNAMDMVDVAFIEWSSIQSDRRDLATGIAFERTTVEANAEIIIYWENIDDSHNGGTTSWNSANPPKFDLSIRFDSTVDATGAPWPWFFPKNPVGILNNQWHFFSVALHEIGHAVGLYHQTDASDLMAPPVGQPLNVGNGPDGIPGTRDDGGRFFQGPDSDSIRGVRDLYSIPAPDFGDAPQPPYPTKKPNGARNLFIGREMLGAMPAGRTTTTWEWDARAVDAPDSGCIFFLPQLGEEGIGFVWVFVSVTDWQSPRYNNAFNYELYLAIWIDWDEINGWAHPGEMIVLDRLRPSTWGRNTWFNLYVFPVPDEWSETWARARLVYANTSTNLTPSGLLPTTQSPDNGGEVEDYKLPYHEVELQPPKPKPPLKDVVGRGYSIDIDVTVTNEGNCTETFNTAVYANTTSVASEIVTLPGNSSTTVSFVWNTAGFAKGNYTISAYAEPHPDEADLTDNNMTDGWVIVAMVGDITGLTPGIPDGIVDVFDLVYLATSYGSTEGELGYKPNADINNDGIIDIFDLVALAIHYGETDP